MPAHRNLFDCNQLEVFLSITLALSEADEVENKRLLKQLMELQDAK
jgi:hypothetical protein